MGEPSPRLRGLFARVLTAAALIPLAVFVVWTGGRPFSAIVAFMVILLIFEWTRMVDGAEFSRGFYTLSLTAMAAVFLAAGGNYAQGVIMALGGGTAATLFEKEAKSPASWPFAGAVYLVLPAIAAIFIRDSGADARALTLLLFATVWATDSGAYLAGTFIGGPKLWPRLSPKKTWTGALGGVLSGSVVALVIGAIAGFDWSLLVGLGVGFAIGVAAVIGDLLESALKRLYGVKDTGGAFPGHGGVLDRLDGFILATSALALLLLLRQHMGA